jgi:hypothetical protein
VVHIVGTHAPHMISDGLIMLVENVLAGTYYGWDEMLLMAPKHQITSRCRDLGEKFSFGTMCILL